ncbi:hypothetical protein So717_29900 [Roseobacter cerasinus]|uniref:Lipoprotein n=1 Tax=Roseobacter cerasinus TaxID=2602289 RepID=A0A640VTR3_9RHOB|nr:hypothetical protein [Roseobacter cerasinus]GFE51237.1 hypothetical protein So717_29900 [Roseobacter cerasinus]
MKPALLILPMLMLTACAEVLSERTSTVEVRGKTYPVKTQTLKAGERVYDVSRVNVRGRTERCLIDSPGDCQAAALEALRPRVEAR